MNALENPAGKEFNRRQPDINGTQQALVKQSEIVKDFFQTDNASEIIASLNRMIEDFLFTENLSQVTPEMRGHIVNNLRVATLVAKLGDCYGGLKSVSF